MAKKESQKQVHIILQGKGGVGKSVIATLLAQYLKEKGALRCIDTDPINPTFSKFAALEVEHLNLLSSPNKINERLFDGMIETILSSDQSFIIDTGAGGFLAISNYIVENDIINVLSSAFDVFIHVPITGGQAFIETGKGLRNISEQFDQKAKIVIWVNEFFGKLGKEIEAFEFYKQVQGRIFKTIIIPEQSIDTFGQDIKMMLTEHKTFNEASENDDFRFMVKRRLNIFKEQIFVQLDEAELCN